jgi:DNA polymerase III subunit delta'
MALGGRSGDNERMWSIIGHTAALAALERALSAERPPHAWLFSGPEGVGKAAVALEFAAALNCTGDQRPCGECRNCRDTLARRHTDVELVAPGGICDEPDHKEHTESRDLRICQIRRVEHLLSLSPYSGTRRVAIIDAADTLHTEAANAFLKTLEEPPPGSIIILLVERDERLPETIMSRCQRLPFRPIERQTIARVLIERGATPEDAEAIAAAASGRLGWALKALEDPRLLEERSEMLDEALHLAHAGRAARFAWAKDASGRDAAIRERYLRELSIWEGWWRDVLLYSAGGHEGATNPDRAATLVEEGKLYRTSEIVTFLRAIAQTREHLFANVDPQLALENLTLDLPSPSRLAGTPR